MPPRPPPSSPADSGKGRESVGPLTFVIASRVGADFGVGAAEQCIVRGRIYRSQFHVRLRGRCRPAASAAETTCEIQFALLPRAQAFPDSLALFRRIALPQ